MILGLNVGLGLNTILPGKNCKNGYSVRRATSSLTILAEVIAIRKQTFMDSRDLEQVASGSKVFIKQASTNRPLGHDWISRRAQINQFLKEAPV